MSTRPTPYGLNAGVSLARWGERTNLELAGADVLRARLDMGLLAGLIAALESRIDVARELRLETHPLVSVRAGRAFLPERFVAEGEAVQVSVRATRPAVRALALADSDPKPFRELAETLAAEFPNAGREQIEELIHRLVGEGLLLSELRPPLTRGEPVDHLLLTLGRIDAARPERERLAAAAAACARWEKLEPERGAEGFPELLDTARAVAEAPARIPPARVDMRRELTGESIGGAVAQEAARAAELLLRLSPLASGSTKLNDYRDRFVERYGVDVEVPLLQLVDPETGLGRLDLLPDYRSAPPGDEPARRRDRRLLERASEALRDGALAVELDDATIAELDTKPNEGELPPSLELSLFVAAASRDALDAGDFRVVVSPMLGSYAAGRVLGRFAYLFGERAERALAEVARRDGAGAALVAELVYQPDRPWLSNVMLRPGVRSHEIPVGAASGTGDDCTIPADQLLVSTDGETFRLRWPAGGTYVDVREGHMLNPKSAPLAAAFLALMRHAGRPVLTGFSWGSARALPRLPRVQNGRVVLAPATWRPPFGEEELDARDRDVFAEGLRSWGRDWLLPRRVFVGQGDQRLLVDLEDPDQVELLRRLVAAPTDDTELILQEALPDVDSAWLPGPDGSYAVELAVPLVRRTVPAEDRRDGLPPATTAPPQPVARARPPGSDWLYLKLYSGGVAAEALIGHGLCEVAAGALVDGLADDWFFIRYRDSRPHLRLRFRGDPETLTGELVPRLFAWTSELIEQGACQSLALDTYERELERYGGEAGMKVAEAIFGVDSRTVAELIALDVPDKGEAALLPVLTLDRLLEGLGLDAAMRLLWCAGRTGARHEVVSDWREHKDELRSLLGRPGGAVALGGEPLATLLDRFVAELRPHGERLATLRAEGTLRWPPPDALHASFAHMHLNRLIGLEPAAERRTVGLLHRALDSLSRAPVR